MADVNIKYKNSSITTMNASGTKTLLTGGKYCEDDIKVVYTKPSQQNGNVTAPNSISGTEASVSAGSNTLTLSKTVSVTPNVTQAGYISSGTAGNSNVSLQANVTTKGATIYYPNASDQSISSNTYLTGAQTIKGVTTNNLIASNIKNGVTIQVGDSSNPSRIASVTGTYDGGGGGSDYYWYAISIEDDGEGNYQFIDSDGDTTFSAFLPKLEDPYAMPVIRVGDNVTNIFTAHSLSMALSEDGYIACSFMEWTEQGIVEKTATLYADETIEVLDTNTYYATYDPSTEAQPSDVTANKWFINSSGYHEGTA